MPIKENRVTIKGNVSIGATVSCFRNSEYNYCFYKTVEGKVINEAEAMLVEMNKRRYVFRDDSEISLINRNAGCEVVSVNSDTYDILKQAVSCSKMT